MSGLFRRNRPPRAAADEETGAEPASLSDPAAADAPAAHEASGDAPVVEHIRDIPAGVDPDEILDDRPTSQRRSKLRRRARLLHKIRELLLRDLGGLVHEIHRLSDTQGTTTEDRSRHEALVQTKLERLDRVEAEIRDLHAVLEQPPGPVELREPGIGGTCPACGELFGSDARFCSSCGMPLTRGAHRRLEAMEAPGQPQRESFPKRLFGRRPQAEDEGAHNAKNEGTADDGAREADADDDARHNEAHERDRPSAEPTPNGVPAEPDQQPTAAQEPVRSGERRA